MVYKIYLKNFVKNLLELNGEVERKAEMQREKCPCLPLYYFLLLLLLLLFFFVEGGFINDIIDQFPFKNVNMSY